MKKLLMFCILVMLSLPQLSLAGGKPPAWTSTELNTSTYTAIEMPSGSSCRSILMYCSDGTTVLLASKEDGTGERNLGGSEDADNTEGWTNICSAYGVTAIIWAKASAGTPDLILLYQSTP
jgi:hypothetical protein